MKRLLTAVLTFAVNIVSVSVVFGGTLITAPIDSRPVSVEYLGELAEMEGDNFYTVDETFLDYFPDGGEGRFADSSKVREQLRKLVESNNKTDTTVILNTSSYFTGGLVGSRVTDNYEYKNAAVDELHSLVKKCTAPKYYIALTMPRNLPETRNNSFWFDNEPVHGLGYFYFKHNKNSAFDDGIRKKFEASEPSQFLMEWGYVRNKADEMGLESLESWEKEFLLYAEGEENFAPWLERYKAPFENTAEMFSSFVDWQKSGFIDEIVVSSDDLQLPNFIAFLYNNGGGEFIPLENGSPIKFSFARTYTTTGDESIYKKILKSYGVTQASLALEGRGKHVNFIFGMDEIPQLIYARDVSKRTGKTTKFFEEYYGAGESVHEYDVLNSRKLMENALNFVDAANAKTEKAFTIFLYDYSGQADPDKAAKEMGRRNKTGNVGLIEIYDNKTLTSGKHPLFERLMNYDGGSEGMGIAELKCYSSWNTAANAIGLGVAHAQIYGIMEEETKEPKTFAESHVSLLGRHILEDGIYNFKIKRALGAEGYKISAEDRIYSSKVYSLLEPEQVLGKFKGIRLQAGGKCIEIEESKVKTVSMPWNRLFDCYILIETTAREI